MIGDEAEKLSDQMHYRPTCELLQSDKAEVYPRPYGSLQLAQTGCTERCSSGI